MTSQPLIELQITTSAFLAAQLLNLQTKNLPFPSAFTEGNYQFVIDHVEFGQNTLLNKTPSQKLVYYNESLYGLVSQEVDGFRPQISQPIKVVAVSLADVEANPNKVPSSPFAINATMILGLNYYIAAIGQDVLSIVVDSVDLAPLPPLPPGVNPADIQNKFMDFVQSFGQQTLHLNLAHSALKGNINVINTGMSVSSDMQRIAFRQELGEGIEGDPGIWQEFYSGDFDDRLQDATGQDQSFAVFESAAVLEDVAANQISEGLASQAQSQSDKPQAVYFQLLTGVGSNYSNNGGAPTITSTFSGNLNTPLCSVGIDVTVVSVLAVAAPNTVTVDTSYSWNTDTSACTIVAGALGTALGIFTDFVLPMSSLVVEPVLFAISGMVGVLVAKNLAAPSSFSMDGCQQVSDTHLICTQALDVQDSALGKLSMTSLQAQDDGISTLGNLAPVLVGNPQIATSIDSQFVWNPPSISCGDAGESTIVSFRQNPQAWVTLTASASVTAQGPAPIFLISATVIEDSLGVFTRSLAVEGTQAPIQLSFNLDYPGDQYFANPYSCQILLLTTGGARLISIPPPPVFSQAVIEQIEGKIIAAILYCQKIVDPWFNIFRQYNPIWSIDPWIGDDFVEHAYEIEILGLRPGNLATLVGTRNEVLQTGIAQEGSSLRLSALVSPAELGEIGILRGEFHSGGGGIGFHDRDENAQDFLTAASNKEIAPSIMPAKRGIAVREQLIIQAGIIPLTERGLQLTAGYLSGAAHALVTTDNFVLAFDISNPAVPVLHFSWQVPGIRGLLVQPRALLAYGEDGLAWLDATGSHAHDCCCGEQPEYYSVVAAHGFLYALTNRSLDVLTPRLRHRSTVALEHSRSLAYVGHKLIAGGRKGLTIFDLSDPARPEPCLFHPTASVAKLVIPPGSSGHQVLAVTYGEHCQLFDTTHREPRLVATFPVEPYYVGSARLGKLILRFNADHSAVRLSYLGKSKTV